MKVVILNSLLAAVTLSNAYTYEAMLPRQAASVTSVATASSTTNTPDGWWCATSNLTQYVDVPKPTSDVLTALGSFGDSLIAPCVKTATGTQLLACTVTNPSAWCSFSTNLAPAMTAAYASYASSAARWWNAMSSDAVSMREECPVTWGKKFGFIDEYWFNATGIHASCYLRANPASSSSNGAVSTTFVGSSTMAKSTSTSKPTTTASSIKAK